jgi:carbon dioxide concentrating mechanism protein CcmN
MPLQPLQLVETPHVQAIGDVIVHPSAAIAPGVILRAAPNSRIVIAAGVCIGMGAVIHAYQGAIEIETGANLGPGVLMVGEGKIGANACIGGVTTIYNASVEPLQVVPAGSVIGDTSRHPTLECATVPEATEAEPQAESLNGETPSEEPASPEIPSPPEPSETSKRPPGNPVYGQVRVNELLFTLFPRGNSLNRNSPEDNK